MHNFEDIAEESVVGTWERRGDGEATSASTLTLNSFIKSEKIFHLDTITHP
jgi:hypothetical protein